MKAQERLLFYEMASDLSKKLNNYKRFSYEELETCSGGFWIMASCQNLTEEEKVYADFLLNRATEVLDKLEIK